MRYSIDCLVVVLFVSLSVCIANVIKIDTAIHSKLQPQQGHHFPCVSRCQRYEVKNPHLIAKKHHVNICFRGCRYYSLIHLTVNKKGKTELVGNMCRETCHSAHNTKHEKESCVSGCKYQAKCFRKHMAHIQQLTKNMMPHFLFHGMPHFGQKFSDNMALLHQRFGGLLPHGLIKHFKVVIHSVAGKDANGKPHLSVQVQQTNMGPENLDKHGHHHHRPHHHHHRGPHHHHHHHGNHHTFNKKDIDDKPSDMQIFYEPTRHYHHHGALQKLNHWFHGMPHSAKIAVKVGLCSLLVLSIVGLLWLCCSTLVSSPRQRVVSITKVFKKKPPQIQSGDIFYVDVGKKPLLLDDELDVKPEPEEEKI